MTTAETTIAARVRADLRDDAERVAADQGVDLSTVIRKALARYVDDALGRTPAQGPGGLFAPAPGSRRRGGSSTSAKAALDVAPRTGTQRARALWHYGRAGELGLTADEVIASEQEDGRRVAVNGMARRVTDLLQAGAIEERTEPTEDGSGLYIVTRPTRNGSEATVYRITSKGRAWLAELRDAYAGAPPSPQTTVEEHLAS